MDVRGPRSGEARVASQYARGSARERQVRDRFAAKGYYVVRGAGSKGGDLIAGRAGDPTLLIEVKATKAGPYASFGPAERKALAEAAEQAGWTPLLIWWPYGRPPPAIPIQGGMA